MLETLRDHIDWILGGVSGVIASGIFWGWKTDKRSRDNKSDISNNADQIESLASTHKEDLAAVKAGSEKNHKLLIELLKAQAVAQKDIEWIKQRQQD